MVAALPQLSPQDGRQLAALFTHKRCLFTLARETAQPLHTLLDWAMLPHIQQAIEALTRLENDSHRAAAIEALRHTMDKTEDFVEKRRAACAILRALNPRVPSVAADTKPPSTSAVSTTSPPAAASVGQPFQVARGDGRHEQHEQHGQPERPPYRSALLSDNTEGRARPRNEGSASHQPLKAAVRTSSRTPATLLARVGARGTLDLPGTLDTAALLGPIILTPDSS